MAHERRFIRDPSNPLFGGTEAIPHDGISTIPSGISIGPVMEEFAPGIEAERAGIAAQQEFFQFATQAAREQAERSRFLFNIYKENFLPGEIRFAREAFAGIPAEQAVGRATADVGAAFSRARGIAERGLERFGVDPSSPRFAGFLGEFEQARAAAEAGARTQARQRIRDVNFQRRLQATQLGRGLPPLAAGGLAAGTQAFGAGAGGLAGAFQAQSQREFLGQQAQLSRQAQLEAQRRQEQTAGFAGIGQLLGLGIGAFIPGGSFLGTQAGNVLFGGAAGGALGGLLGGSERF